MNEKFVKAVGMAVIAFTVIALGALVLSSGLSVISNFISWLSSRVLPYWIFSAFIGGLIYVIYSAAKK